MPWTYRIVDHGQHFALHSVEIDETGNPRGWIRRSIDFAVDRDAGPDGLVRSLEQALAEARRSPILREVSGQLEAAA